MLSCEAFWCYSTTLDECYFTTLDEVAGGVSWDGGWGWRLLALANLLRHEFFFSPSGYA